MFEKNINYISFVTVISLVILSNVFGISLDMSMHFIIHSVLIILIVFYLVTFSEFYGQLEVFLFLPIIISAFQNVYIGFFADNLESMQIQVGIINNYILAIALFIYLSFARPYVYVKDSFFKLLGVLVFFLITYMLILSLSKGINVVSFISSVRNITSPFLFFAVGYLSFYKIRLNKFLNCFIFLGFVIIAFGLLERFVFTDFWHLLNIESLWLKKGLNVNFNGLPGNFYASEKINGEYVRRMVSLYADPVNFGTVIFLIFSISWYLKSKILMFFSFLSIFLIISKGALLGFFVFYLTLVFYKKSRIVFFINVFIIFLCGIGFLVFAYINNSMSVFVHIYGMFYAILELPKNIFGRGVGNIGVIASLFQSNLDSNITESGMGMIVGQLGLPGIFIYFLFIKNIFKGISFSLLKRDKIFCYTLLYAILLNIMFNEVALSPNSCAGYFIILGLFVRKIQNESNLSVFSKACFSPIVCSPVK